MSGSVVRFGLETLERHAEAFIQEIKTLDDDQLIERYRQTLKLGDVVWRMECALAAEMLDRAERKRGGRGKPDEEEERRLATAKKLAAQLEIAPRTILRSAQIHREFFDQETSADVGSSLAVASGLGKSFFQLAVETPDPHATIRKFADAKASNADFSVRDAKRLIATEEAPALDDVIWDGIETEDKRAAWSEYQRACRGMRAHFPWLALAISEQLGELKERLSHATVTVRAAILKQISEGLTTVEEIAAALGKPREFVTIWLDRMVRAGDLVATPAGRKDGARGAVKMLYSLGKNKT
jgi:hypothetical protein